MINPFRLKNIGISWGFFLLSAWVSTFAWAFPENVRHGYTSCASCHVSPTGGGMLTEYGRRTSEEVMTTWSSEKEADFLHGAIALPENLLVGGDVRFLSIAKDDQLTETMAGFPMQAELELGYKFFDDQLTIAASTGLYDTHSESRRYYLMYQPTDNLHFKAGRFFPTYGLMYSDHSLLVRKKLNFNEAQESNGVEVGYTDEQFQVIVNGMLMNEAADLFDKENGFAGRFSYFLGKRSLVGVSYLTGESKVWQRQVYGVFALIAPSNKSYIATEINMQSKSAVVKDDASLPDQGAMISLLKAGYEPMMGLNLFGIIESQKPDAGDYGDEILSYGIGSQWQPRPHWEFAARLDQVYHERYSDKYGYQAYLLSHYYF